MREFHGERWTHDKAATPDPEQHAVAKRFGLNLAVGQDGDGLGDPIMHFGRNGGYQAVNLAYLWGAGRIILLGYDMQATGGKAHWFGDHPRAMQSGSPLAEWREGFVRLAQDLRERGVDVINCTRETALTCFPRARLEDVL